MITNADLTPDTTNSANFQLTTCPSVQQQKGGPKTIGLDINDILSIIEALEKLLGETSMASVIETIGQMPGVRDRVTGTMISANDTGPRIKLEEAISAIRQVKLAVDDSGKRSTGTMSGKRSFDSEQYVEARRIHTNDLKNRTKCLGCGERGHWFRDNLRCMRLMDDRKEQERNRSRDRTGERQNDVHMQKVGKDDLRSQGNKTPSFFSGRGQ